MQILRLIALMAVSVAAYAVVGPPISYTDTSLYWIGEWDNPGYQRSNKTGDQLEFTFVGTNVELQVWRATAYTVTIDGADYSIASIGSSTFAWVDPAGALAEGSHTVKVKSAGFFVVDNNSVRVTGASPALSVMTGYPTGTSTSTLLGKTGWTSYGQIDGGYKLFSGGSNDFAWRGDPGLRFYAAATEIRVFAFRNGGQQLALYQDGVLVGSVQTPSSTSLWDLITLATGLDGQEHLYQVRNIAGGYTGSTYRAGIAWFYGVWIRGTGITRAAPAWPQFLHYGDSIVEQAVPGVPNTTVADSRDAMMFPLGNRLSLGIRRYGLSGSTVIGNGTTTGLSGTTNINELANALVTTPKYAILEGGTNDIPSSAIGDCTAADSCACTSDFTKFGYAMLAQIQRVAAKMTANGYIWYQGILPKNGGGETTWRTAQREAIACYNASKTNGVTAEWVDTSTWISGTGPGTDLFDNVHPNATGYDKIMRQWYPIVAGRLYGCGAIGGQTPNCNGVF
jgi:lysophospholipase L1-like esterase